MNIVITILLVIVGLIVLLLIIGLFSRKAYSIERSVIINKPRQAVFDYIQYVKNTEHYSKWVMTDPNMRKTFRGTDGTPGFVYAWDSDNKNVGKGEQEIKSITPGQKVMYEIRFEKPFKGVAEAYMQTENAAGDSTLVQWGMSSKMAYPMNVMLLLMPIEKMLGKDMDTSLHRLKGIFEK